MLDFIVNVKSGKGMGLRNLFKIMERCYKSGTPYSVHVTDAPGHAKNLAKTLCSQGSGTIVAVGGDGTFHEVINGVAGYDNVRVGFIPSGRGNDFARAANISNDPVKALNDILNGKERKIDIISIGDTRCLNTAGTGIDVDVLQRVAGQSGKITYLVSLIQSIKVFQPYKMTVTTAGNSETYECLTVGVCNGTCIGGGMTFCPPAKVDDGKLDVVIVQMPPDGKIMRALAGFLKGKHMSKSYVKHFTCDEVKIETQGKQVLQLDGEIYETPDFNCKILKGALTTFETSK